MTAERQRGGYDVVVVGGGNAGFCAAHAAREAGASVLLVEKGGQGEDGGNTFYTAGAFRVVHEGQDALAPFLRDAITRERIADTVLEPYSVSDFEADCARVTEGRGDPHMAKIVAEGSSGLIEWMAGKGVEWRLMYERQAYLSEGKHVFFGNLAIGVVDGGKGLIRQHTAGARAAGVEIIYGTELVDISIGESGLRGVTVRTGGADTFVLAGSVVLAAGGFESNAEMRRKYLGAGWENAYVRGTPLNSGDVLRLALGLGAARYGDWGSCHSVAWDVASPPAGGDRQMTNQYTRQSYPIGIVVNREGRRFLDEGEDFRNYTYAKYGGRILQQSEGRAFQIFDAKTRPLLRREEYDAAIVTEVVADGLGDLARRLGVDPEAFERTVSEFNASIEPRPFDPAVKDGRAARTVPPKSNWAMEIDTPPFYGYPVTCGITFTFGGIKVDDTARVLATTGEPIPGLFAAGEIVGGLFSGNYPGGSGLTAGAVYGRLAGAGAAAAATSTMTTGRSGA